MKQTDRQAGKVKTLKAITLLLLLLSPVGGPVVGQFIVYACDIPWEGSYQCSIPPALLEYFVSFTILPWVWVGFFAIHWTLLSIAVLLGFFWHVGRIIWFVVMGLVGSD